MEPGPVTESRQLLLAERWSVLIVPVSSSRSAAGAAAASAIPAFKLRSGSVTGALTTQSGADLPMFSIAPSDPVPGIDLPVLDHSLQSEGGVSPSSNAKANSLWVVGDRFVCEPFLGGTQLGELPDYDVAGYTLVHLTQAEFDAMMQEHVRLNGHYPDT